MALAGSVDVRSGLPTSTESPGSARSLRAAALPSKKHQVAVAGIGINSSHMSITIS